MSIELTITGLCVLVFKSKQDRPTQPDAVEVLCVDAAHHRPRLSYLPDLALTDFRGTEQQVGSLLPDLVVDHQGQKLAELDLRGKVVTLELGSPPAKFSMTWGPEKQFPPSTGDEAWMNWVPSVQELGIQGIRLGKAGALPRRGASARLLLPPGDLKARKVIKDPDKKNYLLWKFPATEDKKSKTPALLRAVANEVVYSAYDIKTATFSWDNQAISFDHKGTLQVALSIDMDKVPEDYNIGITELSHLTSLANLANPPAQVKVPVLQGSGRTGHPICNHVHFVDKS